MPTSFAQNLEDLRLARAFAGQSAGFYIDVGACHTLYHSVTRYFSLRGWSGINIEPQFEMLESIRLERPRDVHLQLGLSDFEGSLPFYEAPDCVGISTFNREWSESWASREGRKFVERSIPVTTLARVCEQYADRPIDFLNVDVEGHEDRVMAGADFTRWRPRIVLIEGDPGAWESGLLADGYLFATTDGTNRFYVREEDRDLIGRLTEPVVVEDVIVHDRYRELILVDEELARERARHQATRRSLDELTREAGEMRARLALAGDLGPSALGLARRGQRLARRLPRLARLVRRAIGA